MVGKPGGDAVHLVREGVLHIGHRQHLLHLGTRIVRIAQHPQDAGLHGTIGRLRVAGDLRHHRLPHLRGGHLLGAVQDHHAGDARIVGLQLDAAATTAELPGDLGAAARQHLHHPPFEPAHPHPGIHLHGVAVHGGAAVARRNVDVLRVVVGDHEAVSGGVNLYPAIQAAGGAGRQSRRGGRIEIII